MSTPRDFLKHFEAIKKAAGPNDPIVRIMVSPTFGAKLLEFAAAPNEPPVERHELWSFKGIPIEERPILENMSPPYVCIRKSLDEQLRGQFNRFPSMVPRKPQP